jgi:hypothetical protein
MKKSLWLLMLLGWPARASERQQLPANYSGCYELIISSSTPEKVDLRKGFRLDSWPNWEVPQFIFLSTESAKESATLAYPQKQGQRYMSRSMGYLVLPQKDNFFAHWILNDKGAISITWPIRDNTDAYIDVVRESSTSLHGRPSYTVDGFSMGTSAQVRMKRIECDNAQQGAPTDAASPGPRR